jgi:hypothetical protein
MARANAPKPPFNTKMLYLFNISPAYHKQRQSGDWVGESVANHLRKANLFQSVTFLGKPETNGRSTVDALLSGSVAQLYWYSKAKGTDHAAGAIVVLLSAVGLGLVGLAVAMPFIAMGTHRPVVADMVLEDVKLVDATSGEVLWRGEAQERVEGKLGSLTISYPNGTTQFVKGMPDLLKGTVSNLVEQLRIAPLGSAGEGSGSPSVPSAPSAPSEGNVGDPQ